MMRFSSEGASHLPRLSGTLVVALALLTAPGCGKSTKPKPTTPSDYAGAVTGPTIRGKLSVTIATDNLLRVQTDYAASGTFVETAPTAQTLTLSGSYDDTFRKFYLTATEPGGHVWLITGEPESYGLSGLADPDTANANSELTYHSLFKTSTDVSVFLGTFATTPPDTTGTFNFSIRGTELRGDAVSNTDPGIHKFLVGTYGVGGADSIKIANPTAGVIPPLAAGRLVGNTASGDYYDASGVTIGTWTGTKQP